MQTTADSQNRPLEWVLIAKGLVIILVVFGHFHPEGTPGWWGLLRDWFSTFHTQTFFVLSGFLYARHPHPYGALVRTKVHRLVSPFLSIAAIFLLIKLAAAQAVTLDYPVTMESVAILFTYPVRSYMPPLWFIHALFLIFLVYPVLRRWMPPVAVLALGILIDTILGTDYPVIGQAMANLPFFAVGALLGERRLIVERVIGGGWKAGVLMIALCWCVFYLWGRGVVSSGAWYPLWFVLGIGGTLGLMTLSHALASRPAGLTASVLIRFGVWSTTIYLFHTLFESTVRIGYYQFLGGMSIPFIVVALLAIAAGVAGPVLLEQQVLRRLGITRRFVLGEW